MRLSLLSLPKAHANYLGTVVKTLWLMVTAFGVLVLLLILPEQWRNFTTVCSGDCLPGQPTEQGLALSKHFGLSPLFYAIFTLVTQIPVGFCIITVMGLCLWRKPRNPVIILLAFGGVTCSIGGLAMVYADNYPWLELPIQGFKVIGAIGLALGLFAFPDGRFVPVWSRYLAFILAAVSLLTFTGELGNTLAMVAFMLTFPAVFIIQIIRYRRIKDSDTRKQIKWVLYSMGMLVAVILINLPLSLLPQVWLEVGSPLDMFTTLLGGSSILFLWLSIAISVYLYKLFDIDLVIRRTILYGGLSVMITGAYVLLVSGTSALITQGGASQLLALLPVAFMIRPLHGVLQRTTLHWFPAQSSVTALAEPSRQTKVWRLLRLAWMVYGIGIFALILWGLPYAIEERMKPCIGNMCQWWQTTPERVAALESATISLSVYTYWTTLSYLLVPLLGFTIFSLTIWRKSGNLFAYLLALVILSCNANYPGSLSALSLHYPWVGWLNGGLLFITGALLTPVLLAFPDGKFRPSWTSWLIVPSIVFAIPAFFYVAKPEILDGLSSFMPLMFAWDVIAIVAVIAVLLYRYRNAANQERKQLWWVLVGVVVSYTVTPLVAGITPMLESSINYFFLDGLYTLSILFFMACLGIAMLFYNLFDVGMVIRRTLVYGGLTFGIVLIYLVFVASASIFTFNNNLLISLFATVFIAFAFQPLRERLQRGVNRLLYGYRDEPYEVLSELGKRLEASLEPAKVLPLTLETIAQTLKLPFVGLAIRQGEQLQVAHHVGSPSSFQVFPLIYAGESIGELRVSAREGEAKLSKADAFLLTDLARQVSVAAYALKLQADLERSRLRVVSAREAARRRLGNDLHDSVGHQLAGLMRRAETASNLLERDPQAARKLLNELVEQSKGAIEHVRTLAHQLHPPELEVLGLADAIREKVQTFDSTELRFFLEVDNLPKLPTAVEVAVYYILQEALSNVLRHARATHCHIRLEMLDDVTLPALTALSTPVLELEVTDNGSGLASNKRNGLGLSSMYERATEVGGTCLIENLSRGGVRVLVHLPCPAL